MTDENRKLKSKFTMQDTTQTIARKKKNVKIR